MDGLKAFIQLAVELLIWATIVLSVYVIIIVGLDFIILRIKP
jgi:hypothetical protein